MDRDPHWPGGVVEPRSDRTAGPKITVEFRGRMVSFASAHKTLILEERRRVKKLVAEQEAAKREAAKRATKLREARRKWLSANPPVANTSPSKRRAAEWDQCLVPCRNHPDRRCMRRSYVSGPSGDLCPSCINRRGAQSRDQKWRSQSIPCRNHPDRRCNRSRYVARGMRRCGSCKNRHANGTRIPSHIRYDHSEQRRWRTRSTRLAHKIDENKI